MTPRAAPVVAPSLILRQNWETPARLAHDEASHWILMRVLTPSSSAHRFCGTNRQTSSHMVLRPKQRNCHGDFEAQIVKPSALVLRPKPRSHHSGFENKPLPPVLRLN
jgi:hypothetical protein